MLEPLFMPLQAISGFLYFIAAIPYIRHIQQEKARPALLTWALQLVLSSTDFYYQVQSGFTNFSSLCYYFAAWAASAAIVGVILQKQKNYKKFPGFAKNLPKVLNHLPNAIRNAAHDFRKSKSKKVWAIKHSETLSNVFAIAGFSFGIYLWKNVDSNVWGISANAFASLAAFAPTLTKTLKDPTSETATTYWMSLVGAFSGIAGHLVVGTTAVASHIVLAKSVLVDGLVIAAISRNTLLSKEDVTRVKSTESAKESLPDIDLQGVKPEPAPLPLASRNRDLTPLLITAFEADKGVRISPGLSDLSHVKPENRQLVRHIRDVLPELFKNNAPTPMFQNSGSRNGQGPGQGLHGSSSKSIDLRKPKTTINIHQS